MSHTAAMTTRRETPVVAPLVPPGEDVAVAPAAAQRPSTSARPHQLVELRPEHGERGGAADHEGLLARSIEQHGVRLTEHAQAVTDLAGRIEHAGVGPSEPSHEGSGGGPTVGLSEAAVQAAAPRSTTQRAGMTRAARRCIPFIVPTWRD